MEPTQQVGWVKSRLLGSVSAILIASAVSGCGVYLHDAQLKTSTANAKASFDALGAPALFATQRQNLAGAATREDNAVAAYAVAVRNDTILSLLRPGSRAGADRDSAEALSTRVIRELGQVYRPATPEAPWRPDELTVLQNAEGMFVRNAQARTQTLSLAQTHAREFAGLRAQGDPRPTDCAKVQDVVRDAAGQPRHPAADAPAADQVYHALQVNCISWRNERDFATADRPDRFDIVNLFAAARGNIRTVLDEIKNREEGRAAAAAQAGILQDEIKRVMRHGQASPGDDADPASAEQRVNQAIATITDILRNGTPLARKAGLEELASIVEQLLAAEMGSAPAAPAAAAPPASNGSAATAPPATAAPATDAPATAAPATITQRSARAAAVLNMIRAGARAIDALGSPAATDRAGALLIGLAKIRHDLNMAKADLALEERERDLLRAQLTALLRRASQLAQAHEILTSHTISAPAGFGNLQSISNSRVRVAASEALAAYARAWDTGEIPYHVLRFRAVQARRMAALDRAELTERDYRALLQPAIDALAAYGEGGITAETIATVLSHLGIAGSIFAQ